MGSAITTLTVVLAGMPGSCFSHGIKAMGFSMFIVVMGIAASGKSTLASALAQELGWQFIEGDDYHPAANITKMRSGIPLNDDDRLPWLQAINRELLQLNERGLDGVIACSALKRRYREILAREIDTIKYVYLYGDPELIRRRITTRKDHFMPPGLLDSQIAAIEPPQNATWISIELPLERQIAEVRKTIKDG
jgi:carbohydrate kinase (thermoresistant glucokinase family)